MLQRTESEYSVRRKFQEDNKENMSNQRSNMMDHRTTVKSEVNGDFSKSRKAQIIASPDYHLQRDLQQLQKESIDSNSRVWDSFTSSDTSSTDKV